MRGLAVQEAAKEDFERDNEEKLHIWKARAACIFGRSRTHISIPASHLQGERHSPASNLCAADGDVH